MLFALKPSAFVKGVWFALGSGAAAASYYALQKDIAGAAQQVAVQGYGALPAPQSPPDASDSSGSGNTLFGQAARARLAGRWNGLVDATLGELARELARRGV